MPYYDHEPVPEAEEPPTPTPREQVQQKRRYESLRNDLLNRLMNKAGFSNILRNMG